MIIMTLVLIASIKIIIEFVRAANRDLQVRDLKRTYRNLTDEQRQYVDRYYNQMKAEGRI
jgi:hypothetical protein